MREAMQEISRPVERVDDPNDVTRTAAPGFLAEKRVFRMAAANRRDDFRFGLAIDVRDEIVAALAVDLDPVRPRHAAHDQVAGAPSGSNGNIEQRLHNRELE